MNEKTFLEQTWYHIEDQTKPGFSRKTIQIINACTSKNYLEIDFNIRTFFGLKIRDKFTNEESSYRLDGKKLTINLGNMANFPKGLDTFNRKSVNITKNREIKIEIIYNEPLKVEKTLNGYKSYFTTYWAIRPEFIIKVPKGMEINNNGKTIRLGIIINQKKIMHKLNNVYLLEPDITSDLQDNKLIYTYVINDNNYTKILDSDDNAEMIFTCEYKVSYDKKFYIIPFFAIIMLLLAISQIAKFTSNNIKLIDLGFLIALFSYSFLIITLHREQYEIPFVTFVDSVVLINMIAVFGMLIIYLSGLNDIIGLNMKI